MILEPNTETLAPLKPLLSILKGNSPLSPPPVWMMRQAGRYLPEYREVRAKAGSFLSLCYDPELAAEVTLQPIRRFGFDAAILFSDILLIPDALGRNLRFVEGEGPRLDPLDPRDVAGLPYERVAGHLAPVLETVRRVRARLNAETSLVGFCGAPFTVATYMIAGEATPDQRPARLSAYREPDSFADLIALLIDLSADFLLAQIEAGADAVQIFDSWAGVLPEEEFRRWVIGPIAAIVAKVRAARPDAPIIGFPKGSAGLLEAFVTETGVDAIGIDWTMPFAYARERLQPHAAVQGNLDPLALLAGGAALDRSVDRILAELGSGRLVFNLGHGILPDTPIEHVERMVKRVRGEG